MQKSFIREGAKLSLWLSLLFFSNSGFASRDMYTGMLMQENSNVPIPISVELDSSYGILSGHVKTSAPWIGHGPIVSGYKHGHACNFLSNIDDRLHLRMVGNCTSTNFEGQYRAYFTDGPRLQGTFKLDLVRPEKQEKKKGLSETERRRLSVATSTACLKANTTCLAACPRGDYNTEFICSNTCRRKLAACKTKGKTLLETQDARRD